MSDASVRASGMSEDEQVKPWWQCFVPTPPPQSSMINAESTRSSLKGARKFLFGDGSHPACSSIKWNSSRTESSDLSVKSSSTSVHQVSTITTSSTLSHPSCSNIERNYTNTESSASTVLSVKSSSTSVHQVSTITTSPILKTDNETCTNFPNHSTSLLYKALTEKSTEKTSDFEQQQDCKTPTTSNTSARNNMNLTKKKEKKRFSCPLCDVTVSRVRNLDRHINTMHSIQINLKPCCGNIFNTKSDLVQHYNIFHKYYGFQCKMCDHIFTRPALLQRHMVAHTHERSFKCMYCTYTTGYKSNLLRHLIKIHGNNMTVQSPPAVDYFTEDSTYDLATFQPDEVSMSCVDSNLMQEMNSNLSYVHKKLRRESRDSNSN